MTAARVYAATLAPGRGVAAIRDLEVFLPECRRIVRSSRSPADIDSVVGWGFKPTSKAARDLAAARGWPYLAMEDGFLRSVGLGESGAPPMSVIVDDVGLYFDARRPSRLEILLNEDGWDGDTLRARARAAMARIVEAGLSKTNAGAPMPTDALPRTTRRRVLVVDQTAGDAAIAGGLADPSTFLTMLEAARRDEPGAEIIVRRHPAVAAGLKTGCLPASAFGDVRLLDGDWRAADILARVDAVYTVSSLTGFEALMRGLPVRCFGMPFYAGWGVTRDEMACARRVRRHDTEAIFAAAYLLYARYCDPVTGAPATAEEAIERLIALRDHADRNAGVTACFGFAPWKRGTARAAFSSPRGKTTFHLGAASATAVAKKSSGRVALWAGRETLGAAAKLSDAGTPVIRMEDGFIRSRGLGSDFRLPVSVVIDDLGIYYDARASSRLEVIFQESEFDDALLARAARFRERLVAAGLSKYNLWRDTAPSPLWPKDRFKLLVPGQVEDDKSILTGCEDVRTNLGLLQAVRDANPDAFIIYKPHPDVEAGRRVGAVSETATSGLADAIADQADIDACLAAADGVATMTSLAGFEALLRRKEVWTFGRPFYAGWGLTHDTLDFPRRTRRLDLDALTAAALILYPTYLHPTSGLPCQAEDVVTCLEARRATPARAEPPKLRWGRAFLESFRRRAPLY